MNYATGTIVKSGKLVPTLILSVVWLRRPVAFPEWIAAGLLVLSSTLMALGEHLVDVNFQPLGLAIAFIQLVAASMQGNVQERVLKDYDATVSEAMLFGNSLGAVLVLVAMAANGEMAPAASFFLDSRFAFLLLLARSVTFLLGAIALSVLTKEYGTGAATAVGTLRKSLTLLFSFALFPKPYHLI
ncbi:unnamed protein product [Prorocentrum cordatum]|uniref:Sugar phosphate transporter domain-containing protein n=1 Tax=Prorocentrum cordatum TaxID=2364126 RepID=A0ABN9WMC9_9DINO|nr:unnamed protein product [Polarella glacialis]